MRKLLFLLLFPLLPLSCDNETHSSGNFPPNPQDSTACTERTRTVLIYMAAQNSLAAYPYFHQADSAEIVRGIRYIPANCQIALFIDDNHAPRLYRLTSDQPQPILLEQWTKDINSTNPKHFQTILERVKKTCPSEEYGLVMWSHADGWIPATDTIYDRYERGSITPAPRQHPFSFGIDCGPNGNLNNDGTQLNTVDLAHAIERTGMHFKFIFFDACLMQNLEVVYDLRHVTDYLVAAPIATPGAGSNYTNDIRRGFFSTNPADIARTYLSDVTNPDYINDYGDFGLTIACLRTDRMETLAQTLKQALPNTPFKSTPPMAWTDSTGSHRVLAYQPYTSAYYYRPHNYDALQALRHLLPAEHFAPVKQALDEAVVFYGSTPKVWVGPGYNTFLTVPVDTKDYRGVSLFIPQTIYSQKAEYTPHGDLNEAFRQTEWYRAAGFDQLNW